MSDGDQQPQFPRLAISDLLILTLSSICSREPMSDDQPKRRSSLGICLAALAVLLLPVAHVLSSGPAVWLFQHGYLTSVLPWIYKPLILLEMSNTPLGNFVSWYWSFWK